MTKTDAELVSVPRMALSSLISLCCDIFLDDGEPITDTEKLGVRVGDSEEVNRLVRVIALYSERASLSRGEPEGFKLVPVEPTEAMLQAGARALTDAASPGSRFYPVGHARTAYAAMLAAAPAPPASEDKG